MKIKFSLILSTACGYFGEWKKIVDESMVQGKGSGMIPVILSLILF